MRPVALLAARALLVARLALFALCLAVPGHAATIHVPGDAPTLQAGIDAAAAGDTVLVAPGTYTGAGNRDLNFGGKDLVLRSSAGPAATVIDPQNGGRGFDFAAGESPAAIVDGFMIRNANAGLFVGGGLSCVGASPTVRNCVFDACQGNRGGGAYLEQSAARFEGCTFAGNSAANSGAGLHCEGSSSAVLANCTFSSNTTGSGAGLYSTGGSPSALIHCTFTGNAATNLGGGIYAASNSPPSIAGSSFSGNSAKHGAAIYLLNASVTLDSTSFTTNTATIRGGGIYSEGSPAVNLTDCGFSGNRITTGGTGFAAGGGGAYILSASTASLTRCTFIGNTVSGINTYGGGLFLRNSSRATVTGCTFSQNTANERGGGVWSSAVPTTYTDCMFTNNTSGGFGGGLVLQAYSNTLEGCTFTGNHAGTSGGAVSSGFDTLAVTGCSFLGNTAINQGGAIVRGGARPASLTGCTFSGNSASFGGALYVSDTTTLEVVETVEVSECLLHDNSAAVGAAFYLTDALAHIASSTLAENSAGSGAGVALVDTSTATLDNDIIAFGPSGEAVNCDNDGSVAVLACCDLFGNAGGDWVGCIADQQGINGCFAADPRFCQRGADNFTLAQTSPCAPANSPAGCGLIGALPVGCVSPIGVAEAGAPGAGAVLRVLPNPVGREGTIEWSSAAPGPVVLRLYAPQGRLVAERTLGPGGARARRLPWPALVEGRDLSSGVYFLELRAGEARALLRAVVIR